MPVTVEVPPRYARRARQLAEERNQSFEDNEAWDNNADSWGVEPVERNYRGLMGEFAFAEYADLSIDTSINRWTDGGQDFEIELRGQPATVDVKVANKEPKALMVKEYAVNADYYVLGHLEENEVMFYGGAWAEQVTDGVKKESPFGHTNYTIGVDYLEEIPTPDEIEEMNPT
ncbi:hypothetical protein GRX03_07125 [Halovenus sp. WSH3]|uniref:Uncharacterized protein n=1 Tax=Halovenus carboxidivorans TaxID=2692199 RepID=A0A6B0T722_9EURY|nr:hypothetical protein [Halovenus carboxidivorans]MXR51373.1 hypothetical protein [Halovenus carboxidivorans]